MRLIIIFFLLLLAGCAHAKPARKPAPTVQQVPPKPVKIDSDDAARALAAFHAFEVARIVWQREIERVKERYAVDVVNGEGWLPDGTIYRSK